MMSIRRRLMWILLAGIGVLLCVAAAGVYLEIADEIGEMFDVQLQQAAYTFPRVGTAAVLPPVTRGGDDDNPLAKLVVEVRRNGLSTPVYHSLEHALLPANAPPGWSTIRIGGHSWRLYTTRFDGRSVEVSQPLAVRQAAVGEIAIQMLLPLLVVLPLVGLVIWFGVGRGLRPLAETATAVQGRSPRALDTLPTTGLPRELAPLVAALNDLMTRLDDEINAQKAFIADAAHALLTPLTALQLQVQLLDRAADEAERISAQAELRAGLSRSIHLARQLLTLAREHPEFSAPTKTVDLATLAKETIDVRTALARSRSLSIGTTGLTPAPILGDPNGLRILLGTLIDNAVKYTPQGGRVAVTTFYASLSADSSVILRVEDSGPGIAPDDMTRVFDRFYRSPNQTESGSGLGLAIARKIAQRHGATLTLNNGGALGGVIAECRFPPQDQL